jgi:hypothetical protein
MISYKTITKDNGMRQLRNKVKDMREEYVEVKDASRITKICKNTKTPG